LNQIPFVLLLNFLSSSSTKAETLLSFTSVPINLFMTSLVILEAIEFIFFGEDNFNSIISFSTF